MKRLFVIGLMLICSSAHADKTDLLDKNGHINGINYTALEVNGKTYDVPMANPEYVQELYYLKRAMKGDKDALDLFLRGGKERWIPIGDIKPVWLKVTSDGIFEVKE